MEACVDLYRGSRTVLGKPPVVVFSLCLGGVPGEGPVAGQLGLTHFTLCVPVLSSRGLSPSCSLAPQLGPQGSLW